MTMRIGVRLGIDVGKARIGVAVCDAHGMLATPVETVPRDRSDSGADVVRGDMARIVELAAEHSAVEIVVGLPIGLSGHRTASTQDAEAFARTLAHAFAGDSAQLPVRLVDERLSTVSAQSQLRQAGKNTKNSRDIIDQAAAVVILQHALDSERAQGAAPGVVVGADTTHDEHNDGDEA